MPAANGKRILKRGEESGNAGLILRVPLMGLLPGESRKTRDNKGW